MLFLNCKGQKTLSRFGSHAHMRSPIINVYEPHLCGAIHESKIVYGFSSGFEIFLSLQRI